MKDITLTNSIPQLGFWTWNRNGQVAYDCARCALDTGYRHVDTAEGYNNEEFVGRAITDSCTQKTHTSPSNQHRPNIPGAIQ